LSNNRLVIDGFDELRAALLKLPDDLAQEGEGIVERHATAAKDEIVRQYTAHHHTGNLEKHVSLKIDRTGSAGVVGTLKSTSPHASLFEFGTQVRHTAAGANRGASPPHAVFIPTVIRERRAMTTDLVELVKKAGFEVTGG
jgi:hypothetical protein